MDWLETTFYYQRAQSAPEQYDFPNLRERVRDTLDSLVADGFVETDEDLGLSATRLGVLASTYYLRLDTAREFREVADEAADADSILRAVANAGEFDSVSARQSERDAIDRVLGATGEEMESGPRKVYAILRGSMDGSVPGELRSDAWVIRQNALRLLAALGAFFERYDDPHGANVAARLEARIDNGVPEVAVGLTALDGWPPAARTNSTTRASTPPRTSARRASTASWTRASPPASPRASTSRPGDARCHGGLGTSPTASPSARTRCARLSCATAAAARPRASASPSTASR